MNSVFASEQPVGPAIRDRISQTTVIIPAAGRVPEGVVALSNIACPAMIPVAGRPVIYWTMSYLRSLGLRKFVIAVARRGMFIEDFVECTFGQDCEVRFLVPPVDGGVGRTVLELVSAVETESVLMVLGDTHFQFANAESIWTNDAAVLVSSVEDSYRWCIAEIDTVGNLSALHDKVPGLSGPLQALIGVYYFPQLQNLRDAARSAVSVAEASGRRTELADILRKIEEREKIRVLQAGDWLDCGNSDRQASSHRTLLQKRAFNELSIDSILGTVTKRSRNVDKFLDEINYLQLLPPELSILFPRVVGYSNDWSDPWLTMEYYGYPTLAEVFVFENVDPAIWEQVFVHLREIVINGFAKKQRPLSPATIRQMYLDKTCERLKSLQATPALQSLTSDTRPVIINGRPVANLLKLWPRMEVEIERLSTNSKGCVIHGDLCLSNILYDLRSRICKLLDPRGSFGVAGIYGDPRYDVAKLYHSVYGMYDFLVNDLFHVEIAENAVKFDIRTRPQHAEICRRFEHVFFADFDRREILLITALLFASMPALHYDAPRRQLAMYLRSLQLLDEWSNSGNSPNQQA